MKLNQCFNFEEFQSWLEYFLPNFQPLIRSVDIPKGLKGAISVKTIGECDLSLRVFVIEIETDPSNRKVSLGKESFNLIKNYGTPNALIAYYSKNSQNWRISLLTSTPIWSEGKIITKLSNPKRHSYILGENAKTATPLKFLISMGKVIDFSDLKERFSLEVVNKEFYEEISNSFSSLVGGTRTYKSKLVEYSPLLKLPLNQGQDQKYLEFAVRLIGRIIFCWFLKEKRSLSNRSLMPEQLISYEATKKEDYYHSILEPIFFEILNRPVKNRKEEFSSFPFSEIPYLNGGLFSPQEDDYYDYIESRQLENKKRVSIPNSWFSNFFDILQTYNFTIDENTSFDEELSIDPEMLGRIFENLLAEINPETGDSARRSTGSYYTPRVIVDYMIDESLLLYLKEKTNIDELKLKSTISYDLYDDYDYPITNIEKEKIINSLSTIKILDPACGSGAFPIGILQKIVFILQQIDPNGQVWFKKQLEHTPNELKKVIEREFKEKNFDYIRKLGVIKENIYGIDIQAIATEITRLRCFLTLIVDERIEDFSENRGIEPLPNLDFKFVTANTLVNLPSSNQINSQMGLFEDSQGIEELKEIRSLYFNASGFERDQLKLQFSQTQNRMLNKLIKENSRGVADLTGKLTSWDPFSHNKSSWFDAEWMFGIKDGFDLIIGNPPYIKEYSNREAFNDLRTSRYYIGKTDIWYLFSCIGIDMLKEGGIETFIAQNNWVTSHGAKKLRSKVMKDSQIMELVDFNDYKIFENAGIQTMIMIFKKTTEYENYNFDYRRLKINATTYEDLIDILNKRKTDRNEIISPLINRRTNGSDMLSFTNSISEEILNKISRVSNFQLDAKNEVAQGIVFPQDKYLKTKKKLMETDLKSGEGIFVLTQDELTNLNLSKKETEIIKPLYSSKEISKWFSNKTNSEWVIYTDSSFKNPLKIEDYPNIKKHLLRFIDIISSDNKPFGLHRARNEKFFIGEKIISYRKCKSPTFSYVDFNSYVSATFYIIKSSRINLKYLTGLLNSNIVKFWLKNKGKMQGTNYQIDKEPILNLPLVKTDENNEEEIVKIVNTIISKKFQNENSNVSIEEDSLNKIFYKIYGMNQSEIDSIENDLLEPSL